jgi:hypothetical protein
MFIAYAQRIAAKVRFCRLKAFSNCVCKILGKDREIADVSLAYKSRPQPESSSTLESESESETPYLKLVSKLSHTV